jgi:hypothetical protein
MAWGNYVAETPAQLEGFIGAPMQQDEAAWGTGSVYRQI